MPETDRTSSFRDLSVGAFIDELASSAPVPGGGSAAAVAAAIGSALVAMVASLSEGRPKYAEHAALHAESAETGRRLAAALLDLADEDAVAYAAFSAARKLPKETDVERTTRRTAMEAAARGAADVPLRTVEACLAVVATAESLVGRSNVNASSDLDVAALLGEAAARGAAANVIVNLPSVGDEGYAGDMTVRVMRMLDDIEEIAAAAHEGVQRGESREPLHA